MATTEFDDEQATKIAALLAAAGVGIYSKPNATLFKYISLSSEIAWRLLEETIVDNRLRLSSSSRMNDPFDVRPVIVDNLGDEDRKAFGEWFLAHLACGDAHAQQLLSNLRNSRIGALELGNKAIQLAEIIHSESMRKDKITCFSRRIDSMLMWGHYADSHRGLAYHFKSLGKGSSFFHVRPVKYSRQRPIIYLSEIIEQLRPPASQLDLAQSWYGYSERAYLTKSSEWAYEEEQRFVGHSDTLQFDEQELVSIVVGSRLSEENYVRLRDIVSRRKRGIKICRAALSKSTYSIEVDWS